MNVIDWILNILELDQPSDIIILISTFWLFYIGIGYLLVKFENRFSKKEAIDEIPHTIVNHTPLTTQLIRGQDDPKLLQLPIPDLMIKLQLSKKDQNDQRIQIEINQIAVSQIPQYINKFCEICLRSIRSGEDYGYYQCCLNTCHFDHVVIWHQKSRECPFCRRPTSFIRINLTN